MKIIFRKEPLKRFLRWSQRALFACGILLLAYSGSVLVDSWLFQRRANRELDQARQDRAAVTPPIVHAALTHGLIGRIEIPRLRLSVAVMEGIDTVTLRRAVGHIPGTAMPGESGNVGFAGHRDTFFRSLKDLKIGNEILVSTPQGVFKYEVVSLRVVEPENVEVLAPSGENVLTLVTCYPFNFVGPAPKRWIVRATQVSR